MTPEQFCYWMQGFVELSGGCAPTSEQWKSIGDHLQQVFNKKTPTVRPQFIPEVDPTQVSPFQQERSKPWADPRPFDDNRIIC